MTNWVKLLHENEAGDEFTHVHVTLSREVVEFIWLNFV